MKPIFKKGLATLAVVTATVSSWATQGDDSPVALYPNNRYPLQTKPYMELPIGSIQAQGWMHEQLIRMRNGMTGHLDKIYEKVMGPRNGWLGGDGDVWERGPYWIDGLLPLAYLLNDEDLIEKVKPWIEWTLASQKENGYFGPDTDRPYEPGLQRDNSHDWWPKMVVLKVMQQYHSATGDKRVIDFFTKYFKYQLSELPKKPLGNWTFWGEQRGGDNLMMVYWLYNITGDKFLLELGELIHKQTFNWTDVFLNQDHLSRPLSLHCVNLAQGFKEPVVYYQQGKQRRQLDAVDKAVATMRNTIGLPTGLWGGDELLRFGSPDAGSELCTAVEMMYSLEEMTEITGEVKWADYLERIAYNVLPTQVTDNYDARQYYQQTNQVSITPAWRNFSTPHDDTDLLFGTLTGYPCCTSNLHQGWPKLVQNLWYATADNGLAAMVFAPSKVKAKVAGGIEVEICEDTQYPFDEQIAFNFRFTDKKVRSTFFPFHVRIPAWCKNPVIKVNEQVVAVDAYAGQMARINREWRQGDRLTIELPMDIQATYWYHGGAVIERGPLLYALKMNEKWEKKTFPAEKAAIYGEWYYEVTSDTPWNYAFRRHDLDAARINQNFTVKKADKIATYPWNVDSAPITLTTKARPVKGWTLYRGSAGDVSYFTQQGDDMGPETTIELIPYGCTTLRITEFPTR